MAIRPQKVIHGVMLGVYVVFIAGKLADREEMARLALAVGTMFCMCWLLAFAVIYARAISSRRARLKRTPRESSSAAPLHRCNNSFPGGGGGTPPEPQLTRAELD
ncbi:hypothetical protein [Singulisphaera sp. PoT]|uniref:hypothetical protein n=1 Tax=Singulisphaera sp. PoT TaxID=3411797 RepID=UPI003BF4CAE0